MNNSENIYKKSFFYALSSAICLVISMFIVYSFSNKSSPNLLLLSLVSFGGFYLVSLIMCVVKKKISNK